MMSAPFGGPPRFRSTPRTAPRRPAAGNDDELDAQLAALPASQVLQTISARPAPTPTCNAPQGLHDFFRAYYHYKSADWKGNKPFPLKARTAEEMAKIPTYYVMELDKGMAATAAAAMPTPAEIARANGSPTRRSPSTPPNTVGPDSRAACRATGCAAARTPRTSPSC